MVHRIIRVVADPCSTPTEADAIANYSHLFRRSEGLYLSPPEMDGMEADFLDACEGRELDLVCSGVAAAWRRGGREKST